MIEDWDVKRVVWRGRVLAVAASYCAFLWLLLDFDLLVASAVHATRISQMAAQALVSMSSAALIGAVAGILAVPGDRGVMIPILLPGILVLLLEFMIMLSERGQADQSGLLGVIIINAIVTSAMFLLIQSARGRACVDK